MQIIVLIAQKGGVGKSTLSTALATAAIEAGNKTMLLDLDRQQSSVKWYELRQESGRVAPEARAISRRNLTAAVNAAQDIGIETLVIDTPPHTEASVLSAGLWADIVLVPTKPAFFDGASIASTIDICRDAQIKAPVTIVLNQAKPRGPLTAQFREFMETRGIEVCPHVVVQRVDHEYAILRGESAIEYNPGGKAAEEIRAVYRWAVKRISEGQRKAA